MTSWIPACMYLLLLIIVCYTRWKLLALVASLELLNWELLKGCQRPSAMCPHTEREKLEKSNPLRMNLWISSSPIASPDNKSTMAQISGEVEQELSHIHWYADADEAEACLDDQTLTTAHSNRSWPEAIAVRLAYPSIIHHPPDHRELGQFRTVSSHSRPSVSTQCALHGPAKPGADSQ